MVTLALQVVFTENAHRYGEHRLCTIDVLEPATHSARGPVVLYCHGGGYVATRTQQYIHSVTPLVRKGWTVAEGCTALVRFNHASRSPLRLQGFKEVSPALSNLSRSVFRPFQM